MTPAQERAYRAGKAVIVDAATMGRIFESCEAMHIHFFTEHTKGITFQQFATGIDGVTDGWRDN